MLKIFNSLLFFMGPSKVHSRKKMKSNFSLAEVFFCEKSAQRRFRMAEIVRVLLCFSDHSINFSDLRDSKNF